MKSNELEFVDSFISEIGIYPADSLEALYPRCEAVGGASNYLQVKKIIEARHENAEGLDKTLYNKKNANYDFAVTFTGGYDYNYLSRLFQWIQNNEQYFGDTILEVGCDIGLVSCFLGRLFPDKQITSVDKYDKSIKVAQTMADKMGIRNVSFRRADVLKLTGRYDTVFSSRTMHENVKNGSLDMSYSLIELSRGHKQLIKPYSDVLAKLVSDDGYLISAERCNIDPMFYGWLLALQENGYNLIEETYSQFKVKELNKDAIFQAGVFCKSSESPMVDDISTFFTRLSCDEAGIDDLMGNWGRAPGWTSLVALDVCVDQFVEGYMTLRGYSGNPVCRYAVYTNKYDKDSSLVYQYVGPTGLRLTSNTFAAYKDANISSIRQSANKDMKNGFTVYRIVSENGVEKRGDQIKKPILDNPLLRRDC